MTGELPLTSLFTVEDVSCDEVENQVGVSQLCFITNYSPGKNETKLY